MSFSTAPDEKHPFEITVARVADTRIATKTVKIGGEVVRDYDAGYLFRLSRISEPTFEKFMERVFREVVTDRRKFLLYGRVRDPKFYVGAHNRRKLPDPKRPEPSMEEESPTRLLVLDCDSVRLADFVPGLTVPEVLADPTPLVRAVQDRLGFPHTAAGFIFTSSQGLEGAWKGGVSVPGLVRFRLFLPLAELVLITADVRDRWAKYVVAELPELSLDPKLMITNQPIYVAAPVVDDDFASGEFLPRRTMLVPGEGEVSLPLRPFPYRAAGPKGERGPGEGRTIQPIPEDADPCSVIGDHPGGRGRHDGILAAARALVERGWGVVPVEELRREAVAAIWSACGAALWTKARDPLKYREVEGAVGWFIGRRQEREADRLGRVTEKPPSYPAEPKTLGEARGQVLVDLGTAMNMGGARSVEHSRSQVLIKVPPGVGKTEEVLQNIAATPRGERGKTLLFVPRHDLGDEVEARAAALGVNALVLKARTFAPVGDEPICQRHEFVKTLEELGVVHAGSSLCLTPWSRCPHFIGCEYVDQFRRAQFGDVAVFMHAHLAVEWSLLESNAGLDRPDRIVIDESPMPSLTKKSAIPVSERNALPGPVRSGLRAVTHALEEGEKWILNVEGREEIAEVFAQYVKASTRKPPFQPSDSDAVVRLGLRGMKKVPMGTVEILSALSETLVHEEIDGRFSVDADGVLWFVRVEPPVRAKGAPLAVLDATASPEILRVAFPRLVERKADVEQNLRVVQVADFKGNRDDMAGIWPDAKGLAKALQRHGHPTLLTSMKRHVSLARDEAEMGEVMLMHYGAETGIDAAKDREVIVVSGKYQPPPDVLMQKARGLWPHEEIDDADGPVSRVFRLADGSRREVEVHGYADERVMAVLADEREAKLAQMVGRLRAVNAAERKLALVLTNVPCDLTVTDLVGVRDLMGPEGMWELLGDADVVPLTVAGLMARWPGRWKTGKSVEMWVRRFKAAIAAGQGKLGGMLVAGRAARVVPIRLSGSRAGGVGSPILTLLGDEETRSFPSVSRGDTPLPEGV